MKQKNTLNLKAFDQSYKPDKIVGRNQQKKSIKESFKLFLEQGVQRHVHIHGPAGSGKTETVQKLLEDLEADGHTASYINCWDHTTSFKIYFELLKKLGVKLIHRTGTPTDQLLDRLQRRTEKDKTVLVLDEADKLDDPEAFQNLFSLPNTLIVLIENTGCNKLLADGRNRSRLDTFHKVEFPEYSKEEVREIVHERIREASGSKPGRMLAREVAETGVTDARKALNITRETLIQDKEPERIAENSISREIEVNLKPQQELLLEIIYENDSIKASKLYQRFNEEADSSRCRRTLRNYLKELDTKGLINSEGEGRWRKYLSVKDQKIETVGGISIEA